MLGSFEVKIFPTSFVVSAALRLLGEGDQERSAGASPARLWVDVDRWPLGSR